MLLKWLNNLHPVHIATTEEEREAVYRFRYTVYYQELGRQLGNPDHERKRIWDPEDDKDTTTILYTGNLDDLTGTVRLRHWPPGSVPEHVKQEMSFDLIPDIDERHTAEIGRFMIRKSNRGKLLLASFSATVFDLLANKHNTELTFCYCAPTLIPYYRKLGARPFGARLVETPDDIMVPLVSVMSDYAYFKRVGSPLAPMVKKSFGKGKRKVIDPQLYQHLFEAESEPVEADPEKIWDELQDAVLTEPEEAGSFLDSLPPDTVKLLTKRGFIIDIPAGKMIARKGLSAQEMFVILDGLFEVTDGGQRLALLGKGDVFGELAFFIEAQRRTATVTSINEGRVLVLHAQTLRDLISTDPATAAHVLLQLGAVMAKRIDSITQARIGGEKTEK